MAAENTVALDKTGVSGAVTGREDLGAIQGLDGDGEGEDGEKSKDLGEHFLA